MHQKIYIIKNNNSLQNIINSNGGTNMVQAIVTLGEREDRVLTIVKGKYGLKNKSDAINLVIDKFEEDMLEPELRPEYVEKLKKIKKEKGTRYKTFDELRRSIENA